LSATGTTRHLGVCRCLPVVVFAPTLAAHKTFVLFGELTFEAPQFSKTETVRFRLRCGNLGRRVKVLEVLTPDSLGSRASDRARLPRVPAKSSRGNEVRAAAGMEGGAGGRGARAVGKVGDVRDEELDDAIDFEIEKVHRTQILVDVVVFGAPVPFFFFFFFLALA